MKNKLIIPAIGILVLIHLALLMPAMLHPDRFLTRDSLDYLDLARTLITTGRYTGTEFPGVDLVRSLGYPIFVLVGIWLGQGWTGAISILQFLVLLGTAWLLYVMGVELGYRNAGFAAVIIFLLNPNAAFWSTTVMSETLAGFLLVLGMWCIVRYWKTSRYGWLFGAGLAFSAGALTRPIVLPIAIILGLAFLWIEWRRTRASKQAVWGALILLIGVAALVLPWQYRNLQVNGKFTLSEVGESTFENWLVAKTLASAEGYSRDEAAAIIAKAPDPMIYSLEVIRRYPVVFIKEQARGILRTILGAEYGTWAKAWAGKEITTTGVLSALIDLGSPSEMLKSMATQFKNSWFWAGMYALAFDILLGVLILAGFWCVLRHYRGDLVSSLAILVALTIIYLVISPGVAGEARFRVPADPLLALAAGWAFLPRKEKNLSKQR